MLSIGPRSCKYFSTLFQTQAAVSENESSTSRITLEQNDAKTFPIMLDFLYSGTLEVTTESAVALRSLARYFQCRELMAKVNEYIHKDLSTATAVQYLTSAFDRNDEKIQEAAKQLIINEWADLDLIRFVQKLPLDLFQSIICDQELIAKAQHTTISTAVFYYFIVHPGTLNARILHEMTKNLLFVFMPEGYSQAFHELIGKLDPKDDDDESWLGLNSFCDMLSDKIIIETGWQALDRNTCMDQFLSPQIEGDYRGSGRLAISMLGSALRQGQEAYSALQVENTKLKQAKESKGNEIKALRAQVKRLKREKYTRSRSNHMN